MSELVITDPKVAKVLVSQKAASYLAPYFGRARSISEAADYLDEPLSRVHHWTHRLAGIGVLEVVERRPRAGRSIAYYRATADVFVVDEQLLPEPQLESYLLEAHRSLLRGLRASVPDLVDAGVIRIYQKDGMRGTSIDRNSGLKPTVTGRGAFQSSGRLLLSKEEAKTFEEELAALRTRWQEHAGGQDRHGDRSMKEYEFMLAMTPTAPKD